MSDDGLILSVIASIGLFGVMLMPPTSDPRMGGRLHYIGCSDDYLTVLGIMFEDVTISVKCAGEGPMHVDFVGPSTIQYNFFYRPSRISHGR